jgi:hypothetical protein
MKKAAQAARRKRPAVLSREMQDTIYSQLAKIACDNANDGEALDSFVAFAVQVDHGSRLHQLAARVFGAEKIPETYSPPIFLFGILETESFIAAFECLDRRIEEQVRLELERNQVCGMIITHECFWRIDIPLRTDLN